MTVSILDRRRRRSQVDAGDRVEPRALFQSSTGDVGGRKRLAPAVLRASAWFQSSTGDVGGRKRGEARSIGEEIGVSILDRRRRRSQAPGCRAAEPSKAVSILDRRRRRSQVGMTVEPSAAIRRFNPRPATSAVARRERCIPSCRRHRGFNPRPATSAVARGPGFAAGSAGGCFNPRPATSAVARGARRIGLAAVDPVSILDRRRRRSQVVTI